MAVYSYDDYGFLSDQPIAGRQTPIAPPPAPWPDGQRPNWTGVEWTMLAYPPPPAPVPVPDAVTPRQIRQALNRAGLRDAVEAAVAAAGRDVQDWWEFALTIERAHPMVEAMLPALGLTPAQADDIFRLAGTL
ncbi:hypothetical protein LJB71_14855 [Thermomonas sp. S9]|uniref:hypothetical protein n=1 Tax=Thermomonas sp. S9 TaxID=2885203 RepID=UPI00216B064E|nr:hypothetical protein [Thermomonas sp. S9]MCR6497091.1 hypothetical protein [Thermomonas sp. S9]MCR6497365.1 hypothetical protein [Thermomonas sp. S9]